MIGARGIVALGGALACAGVLAVAGALGGQNHYTFDEEFSGSSLSPAWVALSREGDISNSETVCYSPNNVAVTGGALVITSQVQTQSCSGSSFNYTSGMVQFVGEAFTYGTITMRARMSGATGDWPALWMLGKDCETSNVTTAANTGTCNWDFPGSDEIDITEITNTLLTTVKQNVFMSAGNINNTTTTTNVSTNFHIYTLVWTPTRLTWLVDGTQTNTETTRVPQNPMFIIINDAVGGVGGGTPSNGTYPGTTTVDYVRVTQP